MARASRAGPSDHDGEGEFENAVDLIERILATPNTRRAWLLGFLTGSALLEESGPPGGLAESSDMAADERKPPAAPPPGGGI